MLAGAGLRRLHPRGSDLPGQVRQLARVAIAAVHQCAGQRAYSVGLVAELLQRLPSVDGSWMVRSVGGLVEVQGPLQQGPGGG